MGNLDQLWTSADRDRIAAHFSRWGWIGFFIQLALLTVPLLLLVYVLLSNVNAQRSVTGINLRNYLSYGSMLVMVFTTFWFYRYTQLGKAMAGSGEHPSQATLVSQLWTGIWAGCLGVFFSMLLLFGAAWRLLFILIANPQTGIMIAPHVASSPTQSISAIDAVSLTSLLILLAAELVVLALSLWLLFVTTRT